LLNSQGTPIDGSLQIFVYNSNNQLTKWSNVFNTEFFDYNYNAGNPDISGQDNTLGLTDTTGEFIIISAWSNGSRTDLTNIPSEFAYIVIELNSQEVYIQNIQLGIPNPITCTNWSAPTSIIQGDNIIALNNNTNEMNYISQGITHYLYNKYNNEIIFPFMGPSTVEFNFNNEGFTTSNVYIPYIGGDTLIDIRLYDYFGNIATCSKITKVLYNVIPGFIDTDGTYILNGNITITSNPTGNIDKIISTSYVFNNENISSDTFVRQLTISGPIDITQYITYFDGYSNNTVSVNRIINMDNIPPNIDLKVIPPLNSIVKQDYEFAHNGTDIDGYISKVKWEVYRNNPDINGISNWNLYYSTGIITDLSNWIFNTDNINGELKIIATVYDNLDAYTSQEYLIVNDCNITTISFDNIDWTKKINKINFGYNIIKTSWNMTPKVLTWNMTPKVLTWNMTPKVLTWNNIKKSINFNYFIKI